MSGRASTGNARPVVVVGGPTASGKSALAIAIAERFGGRVINADSMQIYRNLRILTARPDDADLARVPHRLYGILSGAAPCSAGRWRELAVAEIESCLAVEGVPVVVGGTGLYLRALMSGLHRMPAVPAEVRAGVMDRLAREGAAALHRDLVRRDPATAVRLQRGDSQRIVRAIEILEHTGRGLTAWQTGESEGAPAQMRFLKILLAPPRDEVYAACDARFERMLAAGAVDEVRALDAAGLPETAPVMKSVGVPAIRRHLAGEIDAARMREIVCRDTRRYAKRQFTWFRHQFVSDLTLQTQFSEKNRDRIFSKIISFLLTDP